MVVLTILHLARQPPSLVYFIFTFCLCLLRQQLHWTSFVEFTGSSSTASLLRRIFIDSRLDDFIMMILYKISHIRPRTNLIKTKMRKHDIDSNKGGNEIKFPSSARLCRSMTSR
ncbi:hypothetical protein BYT27DRAFT_6464712 [Phlegmacium glaucopus]|nr:hypothetical protein BYT27DRAFT_6464712 [Phlegmacium glaucopus]